MTSDSSVTNWFLQLEAGQQDAAQKLWERYFARLVGLARKKLAGQRRAAADEEDVALAAFDSFCRGAQAGRFPDMHDRSDLWKLLVVITARKATDQIVHEHRDKRGGGMVLGESGIVGAGSQAGIEQVIGREPTPEFAAQVAEQYRLLLARLSTDQQRRIAELKLEGHSHEEIAALLKCSVRTVERRVGEIRDLLDSQLIEPSVSSGVDSPPADSPSVTLKVTAGVHGGQVFRFEKHDIFLVGRAANAHLRLPLKEQIFSRNHFVIEVNPPLCRVVDLSSRNGTHVNGVKITAPRELCNGDTIRVGQTILQVAITGASDAREKSPTSQVSKQFCGHPHDLGEDYADETITIRPDAVPAPIRAAMGAALRAGVRLTQCAVCEGAISGSAVGGPLCGACVAKSLHQPQPIDGYVLIDVLGKGSLGVVYRALCLQTSRAMAVKLLTTQGIRSESIDGFLREAERLLKVDHPHIVGLHAVGECTGQMYVVTDYVPGSDARRLLKKHGAFDISRAATLACQMLDALAYAHAASFVHADIKPANVLIGEKAGREVAKLADFGLARLYQDSPLCGLTATGPIGSAFSFLAPERIVSFREARPQTDQYGVAAILYQMIASQPILDLPGKDVGKALLMILQDTPVPLAERRPDVLAALSEAVQRALAKQPEDRFVDVAALRVALGVFGK